MFHPQRWWWPWIYASQIPTVTYSSSYRALKPITTFPLRPPSSDAPSQWWHKASLLRQAYFWEMGKLSPVDSLSSLLKFIRAVLQSQPLAPNLQALLLSFRVRATSASQSNGLPASLNSLPYPFSSTSHFP